jgi:hypothetical protein
VVPWEILLCEKFGALPPCGGGVVCEWLGIFVPRKISPSNHDTSIISLTGVCDGIADVSTKLGTLPKSGGNFLKNLER